MYSQLVLRTLLSFDQLPSILAEVVLICPQAALSVLVCHWNVAAQALFAWSLRVRSESSLVVLLLIAFVCITNAGRWVVALSGSCGHFLAVTGLLFWHACIRM